MLKPVPAMIDLNIPGFGQLSLKHLVLDYNGTLALDGYLLPGVREVLGSLAEKLEIHVITADTFGLAKEKLAGLPVRLTIISSALPADEKLDFIESLCAASVVAIDNGRNDRKMLNAAAIGIALIQKEGAAIEALMHAHIVSTSILDALELLRHPNRLLASLRS